MKIYCDNIEIDVGREYQKRGFEKLPPTVTMPAFEILRVSGADMNRELWRGMTKLKMRNP